MPEFTKAASKTKGLAKLVAIDCDESMNKQLCAQFDIKGFPTLKLFPGGPKGSPQDYNGERTSAPIVKALLDSITGKYITKIGSGSGKKIVTLETFLSNVLVK